MFYSICMLLIGIFIGQEYITILPSVKIFAINSLVYLRNTFPPENIPKNFNIWNYFQ